MGLFGFLLGLIPGFSTTVRVTYFFVGVLYPTYESFKAIESKGATDDTQWLSYWVVYAIYQLVETFAWPVLMFVPLYGLLRLLFLAWLVSPSYRGATLAYTALRPFLFIAAAKIKETLPVLEPYIREFIAETKAAAKTIADKPVQPLSAEKKADDSFAPLKTHAQ